MIPLLNSKPLPGTPINKLHPLARGLVGYWLLNDGGMLAWDSSGYGNHGILTNMHPPTDYVGGKFGKALDFDGVDDYADVPNSPELNNQYVTFLVWVQCGITDYTGGDAHIVNKYNTNPATVILYIDDDDDTFKFGVRLDGAEGSVQSVAANVAVDLNWHQVAGTYDGDNIKLYIDGVLQTDINSSSGTIDIDNPNILGIAHRPVTGGFYFNGLIDNISIYNRALSAQEIKQLFIEPFAEFKRPGVARIFTIVGGAAYFKTLIEGLSLVDISQKAMSKPLVESLGLVAAAPPKDVGVAKLEVLTLIDGLLKGAGTSKSEALTLIDSITKGTGKGLSDILTLVDDIGFSTGKNLAEIVSLVDSLSRDVEASKIESLVLIDVLEKGLGKSLSEILSLVDTISKVGNFGRSLSETVTILDSISKESGKNFIDVLTLVDDIDSIPGKNLIEVLTLVDGIQKNSGKTFSDALTLVDTFSRITNYIRTLVDSLILVDTVSKGTGRTITETVSLIDSLSKGIGISKSEVLTLIDVVTKETSKSIIEVISLVDVLSKIGAFIRTLGETVTLVDILSKGTGKELSEIMSLTDNVQRDIGRLLTEIASLIDDVSRTTGKTFIEIVSLIDGIIPIFGKMLIETLTVSDNINRDIGKILRETALILVDSISKDVAITRLETLTLIGVIVTSSLLPTFAELAKLLAYLSITENIQAKESDIKNLEAQEIITDTLEAKL